MSNRELCDKLLDSFSEMQLANIAAMLQAAWNVVNEAEDDAFCEQLHQQYEADPDKGETMTEAELCRELGIML